MGVVFYRNRALLLFVLAMNVLTSIGAGLGAEGVINLVTQY